MTRKLILGLMLLSVSAIMFACSPEVETVEEPLVSVDTGVEVDESAGVSEDAEEIMMEDAEEATYTVSAANSTVSWMGNKPVGNSHTGVIDIAEGELTLAGKSLVAGSFVIDMTSIASTDGAPPRLAQHLNSDDFFGTATFPTASLVIKSAENTGGDQYAVKGDLTIKEITNPIEFTATATETDGTVNATADIVFDRAQYDVQFGSGSFFQDLGDDLIADEIEITVELVAQK